MSRAYRVRCQCKNITKKQLHELMVDELCWNENDTSEYQWITYFEEEGCLRGGQSEFEAHKEIEETLKAINPKALVKTGWTYLDDLPYEEYGSLEE